MAPSFGGGKPMCLEHYLKEQRGLLLIDLLEVESWVNKWKGGAGRNGTALRYLKAGKKNGDSSGPLSL